jgi:hypothetical protein
VRAKLRTALFASALASAVACADVYSTDLEIPSGGGAGPVVDAGAPTTTATGLLSPEPPPVCPDILSTSTIDDAGHYVTPLTNEGRCELGGAICEYGTSPDRNCNQVFSCASDLETWRLLPSERCSASECPKNQAVAAVDGAPCGFDGGANDADEMLCNMTDGVCACTTGRGGNDVHPRRWVCTKPLAACPLLRPNEGQPCQEGMICDYGSCRSKRGLAMVCVSGVWGATTLDCNP